MSERPQSRGEEIANSLSHGAGALAALAATALLVIVATQRSDAAGIVGAAVFGASMTLLYLTSTLFHALPGGRAKRVFRTLDHAAIYLLIAGTYTPFTLGVLRGAVGWTLFGVVWGLALVGIVLKACGPWFSDRASTWLYLGMGWLVVFAAGEAWDRMPAWSLAWLVAGGAAYSLGTVFFLAERVRYFHFVWHLCVLAGSACHVVAAIGATP